MEHLLIDINLTYNYINVIIICFTAKYPYLCTLLIKTIFKIDEKF